MEPLTRYACKRGQIVEFSTKVESCVTEVTAGFISSNGVQWLSWLNDRRLDLSGDPVNLYDEVDMKIEAALGVESIQTETTVMISASKPVKQRYRFANRRSESTRSISDITAFWHAKRGSQPSIFWTCEKLTQSISTLSNPIVRSISTNNKHNMSNFINKVPNFKLKLNTH